MGLNLLVLSAVTFCAPPQAVAEDSVAPRAKGEQIFQRLCAQCHGPDGRGGPQRAAMPAIPNFTDAAWQKSRSNIQMTISILEGKNLQMPANRGPVSDEQAPDLVAYIRTFGPAAPSTTAEIGSSDFDVEFNKTIQQWGELTQKFQELTSASPAASVTKENTARAFAARPSTSADVDRGRELFMGEKRLANGGASCISCHAVHGSGPRDGGRLGPDLTKVYERVGGRTELTDQLITPTTPAMRSVYRQHALEPDEALSLVAFLEETDKQGVEQASAPPLKFFLLGLGGTVLGLASVSSFWRSRFGPQSRPPLNGQVAATRSSESEPLVRSERRAAVEAAPVPAVVARSGGRATTARIPEDYLAPGL